MANPSKNPRIMDGTADEVLSGASGSEFKPHEIMCDSCGKVIPNGESHTMWFNFDKRSEHFHDSCFGSPAAHRSPQEPESPVIKQFPEVIGHGLAAMMRERTAHGKVEGEMDDWFRRLSPNKFERNKQLQLAREQIETAKLAIEALYGRFRTLATSAKN
jgi:hypothetical protein